MKPKINRVTKIDGKNVAGGYDSCQTPPFAIDPMLPFLHGMTVWEPAAGEGYLVRAMRNYGHGIRIIDTDIIGGCDFRSYMTPFLFDAIATNPPYSNPLKFEFIERCYEIGMPWALLMPIETIGASRAQASFKKYGVELTILNRRVNFKMPKKGWKGSSAQFPVAWFSWKMTGETLRYCDIYPREVDEWGY